MGAIMINEEDIKSVDAVVIFSLFVLAGLIMVACVILLIVLMLSS